MRQTFNKLNFILKITKTHLKYDLYSLFQILLKTVTKKIIFLQVHWQVISILTNVQDTIFGNNIIYENIGGETQN